MSLVVKLILWIILILVIVEIIIGLYFYRVAIARTPKKFMKNNPDLKPAEVATPEPIKYNWADKQEFEEINIMSEDGLNLHSYYLKADIETDKTVILAHGYSGQAKSMGRFAEFYHEKLKFNILMPDNRGHGKSEGNYIGFGWHDRKDYIKWINYIIDKNGKNTEIVLHGVSMGAATVLMVSGEKLPKNVKVIIADCAYTSAKDELAYQLKRMHGLPAFPVIQITSFITKLKSGYYFGEASSLDQVAKAKLPILFIHGDADVFVPYEMAQELYHKCASKKELFVVKEAEHAHSYNRDKENYEKRVSSFIDKYMER